MSISDVTAAGTQPVGVAPRPLDGVRVLDLTAALAGPFCTLILGGLGADVIKIESPGGGDFGRTNPPFLGSDGLHFGMPTGDDVSITTLNRIRNKRSVTVNLKDERGRELFYSLARQSDVVVENLSDGVVERLGVDYPSLRQCNPGIVYCSITGVGRPSPMPKLKSMDIIIQALSGVMEVTGDADGPPTRVGIPIGDLVAPLYATSGILAALRHRDRTGEGQYVEVSLLDSLSSLVAEEHFDAMAQFGIPIRTGNSHPRLAPFGVYGASDGYVAISGAAQAWMIPLSHALGRPELIEDPRFSSRGARARNAEALDELIAQWTGTRTVADIVSDLQDRGVPAAAVRSPGEVLADEDLRERGAVVPLAHPDPSVQSDPQLYGSGLPIRMSATPVSYDRPAPALGQDTGDVLGELLGLDQTALSGLADDGII